MIADEGGTQRGRLCCEIASKGRTVGRCQIRGSSQARAAEEDDDSGGDTTDVEDDPGEFEMEGWLPIARDKVEAAWACITCLKSIPEPPSSEKQRKGLTGERQ